MDRCVCCEHYYDCEYAEIMNFCEDCRDYLNCSICTAYCKAGFQIECNNGFEEKSIFDE